MSSRQQLLTNYFHQVWTLGNTGFIDQVMHPDILNHGLTPEPLRSAAAFKSWYTPFRSLFSDITCDLTHYLEQHDLTACRVVLRATHTGPALAPNSPANTGARIALPGIILCRWQNNLVTEGFNEFDRDALLAQLNSQPARL